MHRTKVKTLNTFFLISVKIAPVKTVNAPSKVKVVKVFSLNPTLVGFITRFAHERSSPQLAAKNNILYKLDTSSACSEVVHLNFAYPSHWSSIIKKFHAIFAFGGFALTALAFWFLLGQWYFTVAIALAVVLAYFIPKDNKIWCLEVTLAYLIFISLFLNAVNEKS